jgi:hypothetical protein
MEAVLDTLREFDTHSLDFIGRSSLMSRIESKFIVARSRLPILLSRIRNYYSVLDIDGELTSEYENTYYDTPSQTFYFAHHSGRLNRYKVRRRVYQSTSDQYLEIKFKNNKKRTIKWRQPYQINSDIQDYASLLQESGLSEQAFLSPRLENSYTRMSFADEVGGERITLDTSISFINLWDEHQRGYSLSDVVIAELKQGNVNRQSPFFSIVRELGIRPTSFSKYCAGVVYTSTPGNVIKHNRFKSSLRRVALLGDS